MIIHPHGYSHVINIVYYHPNVPNQVNPLMSDTSTDFSTNNLVIYREKAAIVTTVGAKIEIKLATDKTVKVRPKDIQFLHPGPLTNFSQLTISVKNDIDEIRELLEGETTNLDDLMELMYEQNSPAAAWAIYEFLQDGLFFTGTLECISPTTQEEYEAEFNRRNAKEAEKTAWTEFMERVRTKAIIESDHEKLQTVVDVAYGTSTNSKILKELSIEITPENAHTLLLNLGVWDYAINPYIKRFGLSTDLDYPEVGSIPDEERLDLTHLAAYAIDDEDNKDPDDAVSYDNGTLWIHIADVASIVQPDSELDIQAKANAANLYLPETTVTMLPEKITALYGLGLSEYSPALSFAVTLKESGEIDTVKIHPSTIKVTRTTYRKTEEVIDQSPFKEMYAMAAQYQAYRIANNAVMLNFPEVKIRVENDLVRLIPIPHLKAQKLVTNAMLMTGESAAQYAQEHTIPFLYTTQPAPDLTEVPEEQHTPSTLSDMFAFRRYMKGGQMKASPEPHSGLGLPAYSRATSPIRRYVDLIAHQQIRAHIKGQTLMDEQEILNRVGAYEASIGSIVKAERMSNRHWTLVYLMQNPDWKGTAIVVAKKERFSIVMVPELGFESRISLQQNVELDDEITLSVNSINLPQLEVYFQVVE